jgi:hypothetical protein
MLPIDNYYGQITINVLSEGISLLTPDLTIYDKDGELVQVLQSNSNRGDRLAYSFNTDQLNDKIYVNVSGSSSPAGNRIGSYALITTFDDALTVDFQDVLDFAQGHFSRASQEEVMNYFLNGGEYLFNEDNHENDDSNSAMELEIEDGYLQSNRYELNASLTDGADVDFYRIESEEFDPNIGRFLNVTVRSTEIGGLVPIIEVFDDQANLLDSRILVNQRGETVIQVSDIRPDTEYFISVAAHESMPFTAGNYAMTVSFGEREVNLQNFAGGSLSAFQSKQYHSLHVAQSQMFHFALQGGDSTSSGVTIWATIYDQRGEIVFVGGTTAGETYTSHAAFFSPGSYLIEIEMVGQEDIMRETHFESKDSITYDLLGIEIGDPQGAPLIDPTDSPFKQNEGGEFIYPDDVISTAAFVFVAGIASNLPDPPDDGPPKFDIFDWYWKYGI